MIHATIIPLLSEELKQQLEAALKGKGKDGKDVELVIGNDGSHVPAHKLDTAKGEAEASTKALKTAVDALKKLGGSGDPTKLAEDVEAVMGTIDTLQKDHQKEITGLKRTSIDDRLASEFNAHDPKAVRAYLDPVDDGVDEAGYEAMRRQQYQTMAQDDGKKFLFRAPEDSKFVGMKPGESGDGAPNPKQGDFEARLAEARKTNDTLSAIQIKQEASAAGIHLI